MPFKFTREVIEMTNLAGSAYLGVTLLAITTPK